MKRRMWICVIVVLLAIALPAGAVEKLTDQADLRASIADCAQFGQYDALAEALLCAASIPYAQAWRTALRSFRARASILNVKSTPRFPTTCGSRSKSGSTTMRNRFP